MAYDHRSAAISDRRRDGRIRQAATVRAVQHEHDKAAMKKVKDRVKSQLLALVGMHDDSSAWRVCISSLHYDFPTCRGIVALLAGESDY